MTPERYAAMTLAERAHWITQAGPLSGAEQDLVLADNDPFIQAAAAMNHHMSEEFLQRLHDTVADDALRELVGTNPSRRSR
ncbi:hypothetical protein [Cellulomonas septica]|uniref:Uncharacterized protein n=1 Tax=Cellulomonas septica TaxID=285080 RepID=A0ABX1K0J5_9CELL|nr:hypothetical protein [Cellulomonas septica]NKY39694.1 hypothetical protein [Cellulomonas septica]